MLVVKLEIHPGGDATRAREIGRAAIANVTDLSDVSDYMCTFTTGRMGNPAWTTWSGMVKRHRRSDGPWVLIGKALRAWMRDDK